ncbi:hypothetical protein [Saccharomonospora saliphila]|uniref:hypothetical protein n=1 Tax=Saccharomonospora saliphila TaxID=369829 RepID=UPI00039DA579|nr:hypothetical protein [Saccharomonospora saliphila]
MSAAEVAVAAGVERRVFGQHYRNVLACGAAAFDEAAGECWSVCAAAWRGEGDCVERYRRVVEAVLRWTASHRDAARFLFVVAARACEPILIARLAAFKESVAALIERPGDHTPAGSTHVEFVVGLVFRAAERVLGAGADADPDAADLRRELCALTPFVRTPLR